MHSRQQSVLSSQRCVCRHLASGSMFIVVGALEQKPFEGLRVV